ncbi:MAG: DUF2442 domain-containing protein [Prevotellaceae bacterium]|jgi:hypothetical protein|nr:DUF2442 domain-containing protein [Prevotellaceae bacterium]
MKIVVEYTNTPAELLEVQSAEYAGNFVLHVSFSDGFTRMVDFKPFLANSFHPSIRQYLNENKFKQFEIVDGNLNWNDYELIFPVEDLYRGKI